MRRLGDVLMVCFSKIAAYIHEGFWGNSCARESGLLGNYRLSLVAYLRHRCAREIGQKSSSGRGGGRRVRKARGKLKFFFFFKGRLYEELRVARGC